MTNKQIIKIPSIADRTPQVETELMSAFDPKYERAEKDIRDGIEQIYK